MLRDVRTGSILYVLDKRNKAISQAEVLQTMALPQQFQYTPNGVVPMNPTVAIRVRLNGKEAVFNNLLANQASGEDNGNGIVVCENKDALVNEIKAFKMSNDNMAARVDEFKENSAWCDNQLVQLDPIRQAEVHSTQQIDELKKEFADFKSEMKSILSSALGTSQKVKEK